jgi:hypothetical protein
LIELGSEIEEVNFCGCSLSVGNDDKRVDLQVGELAIDVDGIETGDEIYEDVVHTLGDFLEECGSNLVVGGILCEIDGNEEFFGFGINVTNVNTALVREEDPVALETLALDFLDW